MDDIGRVFVKLIRSNSKYSPLFNSDGEVNEKLPKTIIKALGSPAEDIIRIKEEEISRREKKIEELKASHETASENQRVQIDANIEEQRNEISRLEAENEHIEERMSLRDRVKSIFKKYGFTVFAFVSAVGLVIGVIVNNLKKGLTSLGKGVGGALKNIGKKTGEILPGMIGAIASFVFKTAGEAVLVSEELTKIFNVPHTLEPYSVVKISGDEKYFVYCDLVENNNSLLSNENNSGRIMPSKLLAVAPKSESGVYPELLIPADKRVINNITLRIENEKFEVPDFNDEEIIYVLKIW